jgi:hypothetical protein
VPTRWLPPLLIAGLGLLFFADLVIHPGQVLYSDYSDILAEHLPAKHFLVRSWHETGELPLWCPYSLGGSPFVHDIQVAMFYPPHFVFLLLPEEWIGPGLSWLIVAHVIVAGWCMYAYARSQGLGETAALVAAFCYMFAGKWLLHLLAAGHYITIGLAWLPLVLLCLERAVRRRSVLYATWAGGVYGLLTLGTQPQWTFYAGIFLAMWTLGTALEQAGYLGGTGPRSRWRTIGALGCWLGCGAWTAMLAVALAAVQFLPTLEAVGQSMRSHGLDTPTFGERVAGFVFGLTQLPFLAGPSVLASPPYPPNAAWEEYQGGFVLLLLTAAILAPLLQGGLTRYRAFVCLLLFVFSFGGWSFLQGVPGFSFFRQHARMQMVAALPVAFLAGVTTQLLFTAPGLTPAVRQRGRWVLSRLLVAAAILIGVTAVRFNLLEKGVLPRWHLYWLTLLVTVPAAFWLFSERISLTGRRAELFWCGLLLLDLWGLAWPLVAVRPEAEIYPPSQLVDMVPQYHPGEGRVLDYDARGELDTPLGGGASLAMLHGIEAVRGYNPLDTLRFKEYLHFIRERDTPLRPLNPTDALSFPVITFIHLKKDDLEKNPDRQDIDFTIRNKPLLDLLGVRYLLQPSDAPLTQAGWQKIAEDARPEAYNFNTGGVRPLPSYTLYENQDVAPRAFLVGQAAPLPDREHALHALKATDFRQTVLLEDFDAPPTPPTTTDTFREAKIRTYQPNRVVVDVDAGPGGYLVLGDVWYPGWKCTVDGQPVKVHRANFLFRAVPVPAGAHEVAFTFVPESYLLGRRISVAALALLAAIAVLGGAWRLVRREGHSV